MSNGSSGVSLLAGFLLGAATGAAIGLLLAPQPGEGMRQQLKDQTVDLRSRAQNLMTRTREQASDEASNLES